MPTLSTAIPQLPSGDIETTAQFFQDILGFEVLLKLPAQNHLILKRGQAEIHFWQAPSEAQARKIGMQSSCYIRVQDIEPLYQEFKTQKAPFANSPNSPGA